MTEKDFFQILRTRNYHPGLVNNDMLYLPKTKCIYIACSKNACSRVKSELYKIEHGQSLPKSVNPHNRAATGFLSPVNMPEQRFLSLLKDPAIPKFAFVRNPFKRAVSCFRNRIGSLGLEPYDNVKNTRTEWIQNRQKILAFKHDTPITYQRALVEDITFEDFIQFICHQHPYEMDRHWYPQARALFYDVIDYTYIGQVESLTESLNRVARLIGAPDDYLFDGKRLNKSTWLEPDLSLAPETVKMFEYKFAEDYALWLAVKEQYGSL